MDGKIGLILEPLHYKASDILPALNISQKPAVPCLDSLSPAQRQPSERDFFVI